MLQDVLGSQRTENSGREGDQNTIYIIDSEDGIGPQSEGETRTVEGGSDRNMECEEEEMTNEMSEP